MSQTIEIEKDPVKKLDTKTSSAIRKGQIVTKVSDVVRELIDNSVDAGSNTIQVLLEDFGLAKIEVRDTGCGISQDDFKLAFSGGHTSKLNDSHHLSSHKQYGFRGEALASICSMTNVTVSTKTQEEHQGRKYVLNKEGEIISESKAPIGNGTTVTVKDIFCNFPVRRKFISGKKQKLADLKEIEVFLKAMAIANHKTHFSLYHDGNLLWTKPSVTSMDQALVTVLGIITAKKLTRCGPSNVSSKSNAPGVKGIIELFVPQKPVDYKTMSLTSNKNAMFIFVNRRRVQIREFEKIIQRYVASVSEKPAPADNHRFPISVLSISVPPKDVDFNRDMDKTKVFLTNKDEISEKLEEMVGTFYGVDLSNAKTKTAETSSKKEIANIENQESFTTGNSKCDKTPPSTTPNCAESSGGILNLDTSPVLAVDTTKTAPNRNETILAFLENIPSQSETNFAFSPTKNQSSSTGSPFGNKPPKSFTLKDTNKSTVSLSSSTASNSVLLIAEEETRVQLPVVSVPTASEFIDCQPKLTTVSNFDVNLSLDILDDTQPPEKRSRFDEVDKEKWVQGRLEDKFGGVIENVAIIRGPVVSDAFSTKSTSSVPVRNFKLSLGLEKPGVFNVHNGNSTSSSYNTNISKKSAPPKSANASQISQRGRQITLDSFRNWKTSSGKPKPDPKSQSIADIRSAVTERTPTLYPKNKHSGVCELSKEHEESPGSAPNMQLDTQIGFVPPSVKDYLEKRVQTSNIFASAGKTVNSSQFFSSSQREPEEIRSIKPKIVGFLPGTYLCIAKVDGYLGVFSPTNLLETFPEFKEKYSDFSNKSNLTEEQICSLLTDFISEGSLKTEKAQKIFHVLTDLDVTEFEPRVSSTQYSL